MMCPAQLFTSFSNIVLHVFVFCKIFAPLVFELRPWWLTITTQGTTG